MGITLDSIKSKMLGKTFGKLTIEKYIGRSERGDNLWKCRCSCGNEVIGRTANVDKPTSACINCKYASSPKSEERRKFLLDKTFGRLLVIGYAGKSEGQAGLWQCLCQCGNVTIVRSSHLILGKTKSCGCYARDRAALINTRHGLHRHPLYEVWSQMKSRCDNPNHDSYPRYGGRGIQVCEDWLANFMSFYNWAMTHGYESGLTIERTNNNGNYEPGNCIWATQEVQNQNTSRNRLTPEDVISIREDPRSCSKIASDYGVDGSTISRIKNLETWTNV